MNSYVKKMSAEHPWYNEYAELASAWKKREKLNRSKYDPELPLVTSMPRIKVDDTVRFINCAKRQPDIWKLYVQLAESNLEETANYTVPMEIIGYFQALFLLKNELPPNTISLIPAHGVLLQVARGEIDAKDKHAIEKYLLDSPFVER